MAESWSPTLEDVAGFIPTRTRDASKPGSDTLLGTFTTDTTPTDEQATRTIRAAAAHVLGATGPIPAAPEHLSILASTAAALRAAADIELAFPDSDADVQVYEQLNRRAEEALQQLVDAVNDAGSGPEGSLLPVWVMPEGPWWGDYPL
ncbi:hypothetical protein [Streptosporangium longisporum]|uniref:DUF4253 domain-containing protein n=1 Tax=Streptosporangium longisporum TaxID=46187 RepID=A0ABP6L1R3_9ACTN